MPTDSDPSVGALAFLGDIEPRLVSYFSHVHQFAHTEPEMALSEARKFLERLLHHLALRHGAEPQAKGEELIKFIDRLHFRTKCLPRPQVGWAHEIRMEANDGGAHASDRIVTPEIALATFAAMEQLAEWFEADAANAPAAGASPRASAGDATSSWKDSVRAFATQAGPIGDGATAGPARPRSRKSLGIAAAVVGLVAVAWGAQHLLTHKPSPNPQFPIEKFATPLREHATSAKLNVRTGPGATYPTLKQIVQGDALTGYGSTQSADGGLWHYVQLADGSYGYVNAKLVEADPPVPPTPGTTTTATDTPAPQAVADTPSPTPADVPAPPPPAPVIDEGTRVRQIITASNFYYDQSPDPGRSMMLRVDATYANAREGDVAPGALLQNGLVVQRCNAVTLQTDGSFWCRMAAFAPGDYQFTVGINGTPVLSHVFSIQPTQVAYATAQPVYRAAPQPAVVRQPPRPGFVQNPVAVRRTVVAPSRGKRPQ
jgi:hypothetical protein